ncbi:MAG TPA: hypothetical protein VKU87_03200, partial [Thermomicrobiaceae bacterium]|nr:hypothetical protein [Thermomicrobiaceae bacterium]
MRVRRFLAGAVLVLAIVGLAVPASADSGPATLKYEGTTSSSLIWQVLPTVYVPTTPYISDSSTPLISKIFFTVHDSANYAYWVRFGWCYANPAEGGPCASDYDP